jgi:hypothetical protein
MLSSSTNERARRCRDVLGDILRRSTLRNLGRRSLDADHWPTDRRGDRRGPGDGPPLSGFFLTDAETTHVLAVDVDADDWRAIELIAARLLKAGVSCYPEHSRRGGHLWIVADSPMPAIVGRRALMAAAEAAGLNPSDKHLEIRPSTDRHSSEFAGGSLRLPWMRHPATGERYGLLDPSSGAPLHPRVAGALLALQLADVRAIARLAEHYLPPRLTYERGPRPAGEGVSAVLATRFGLEARPGHSVRCPFHPDHRPSMKIAADDQRAWCYAPTCEAYEDGRGITAWQAARLAGVA